MEYCKYISKTKELSYKFHRFIEDEMNLEENFKSFINFLKTEKYEENRNEFKLILHMINNISNNHYRCPSFLAKIEKILLFYSEHIKQSFRNDELYNIFQNNKRILLFLFEHKIITIDELVTSLILKKDLNQHVFIEYFSSFISKIEDTAENYFKRKQTSYKNYRYYFFPEIKEFLDEKLKSEISEKISEQVGNTMDDFESNRHEGENESYICQLIRKDSIKDFIVYINQRNLPLSGQIRESIFETNPLLLKKHATIIEYSAFYGSIQIFKYLQSNGVELKSSLWPYVIHGNNPEMIQILVENQIKPEDQNYVGCLQESIKCHHNNIAEYILNNLIPQKIEVGENNFSKNQFSFGFHYHNYEFIQDFNNLQFIFYYACLYDYFSIVKLLIESKEIDLNKKVIFFIFNRIAAFVFFKDI